MKTNYFIPLVVGVMLCSCSSVKHTATSVSVEPRVVSFTVADVTVAPTKITKTTSWSYNPFRRVSVSLIKENTTAEMLRDAGADVLVEPEYIIEQRGFLRGGSVTVTGFPATYSNFHKMTPQEAEVVKAIDLKKENKHQKKRFFFF